MREICTSGSEGGGAGTTGAPYPYHVYAARTQERRGWPASAGHDIWGFCLRAGLILTPMGVAVASRARATGRHLYFAYIMFVLVWTEVRQDLDSG